MITKLDDSIHREVLHIIEETSAAYHSFSRHDYTNSDYADFAAMALSQFKNALRDPALTREQLEKILRKGMKKHRSMDPDSSWSIFMASYVTRASNGNPPVDGSH
ncbi:MAG: hypothetical protein H6858_06970 [Rhodospirillales bacterium]|nr:hypothetical protein [Alphaproteobacteria bacterium]MCB1840416.1 hypothetical protein [Alphaproteobacteria bacterium]MCB9977321.1 hypothetical protein [Rhodospirillales bacterium]